MTTIIQWSTLFFLLLFSGYIYAQTEKPTLKVPSEDLKKEIAGKSNAENDFGKSEEQLFNFTGDIYYLPTNTNRLPNFKGLKSVGKIYTNKIFIPDQAFDKGLPGLGYRYEFFAIDYNGKFYIKDTCSYCFMLGSDDGSKLLIDDTLVINNDYGHPLEYKYGCKQLKKGFHKIEVQYFQGVRYGVALILRSRKKEAKNFQIFDLTKFYPISIKNNGISIDVTISDELLFENNSFELSEEAKQALGEVKRVLLDNIKIKSIIIEGHTDDTGSLKYNAKLSSKRANEVKKLFTSLGVNAATIVTKGSGKTKPKVPNTDDASRKQNRRIEIQVLKMQ